MENPRIGLVLLRAGWLGAAAHGPLLETLNEDVQQITGQLEGEFAILGPWMIDSAESTAACRADLAETRPDLVVVAFQTWIDQPFLEHLLQDGLEFPLVLWCYLPWRRFPRQIGRAELVRGSGASGAFDGLGMLHNLNIPFLFAYGAPDDPHLVHDLRVAGRAAGLWRMLRRSRLGILPGCHDSIQGVPVDLARFTAQLGPAVQVISAAEYQAAVQAVAPGEVEAYRSLIDACCPAPDVTPDCLTRSVQAALGLRAVAIANRLDVLAINGRSPDVREAAGLRPGLPPDLHEPSEVIYQPEGDLGAALAGLALANLSGSPTFFMQLWFWDEARNQIIGGHGGMQNFRVAGEGMFWLGPGQDVYPSDEEGAQIQFIAHPGRVTLFQIRPTFRGWKASAATGICLESLPCVETSPHALVRLDPLIDTFIRRLAASGSSPFWVMAYGSLLDEVEAFCQMGGIELDVIR